MADSINSDLLDQSDINVNNKQEKNDNYNQNDIQRRDIEQTNQIDRSSPVRKTNNGNISSFKESTNDRSKMSKDISFMKECISKISDEICGIKISLNSLHEELHFPVISANTPMRSSLKRVTFIENPFTLDELIKFKIECKNRVYEAIYNARGPRSVVSPAYVDEKLIQKLSVRDRTRIYIPGKPEPIFIVTEVVTASLKIGSNTYTFEAVLHRDRTIPVVLGKDFGHRFIIGISMEHKILTLQDDDKNPIAIPFEFYKDSNFNR